MKAGSGPHFEQAYNAQAAVDEAMLIVGQRVIDAPNDKQQLVASVAAISPVVAAQVQAVLVDSGFYSEAAVAAVEQKPDGTASGRTVYAAVEKHSHHRSVADLLPQPEPAAPAENPNGPGPLQTAPAKGGTGLWHHQRSDGVPAVPVAGPGESCAGMDAGVRELQPQASLRAQKTGGGGIKSQGRGRAGRKPWRIGVRKPNGDEMSSAQNNFRATGALLPGSHRKIFFKPDGLLGMSERDAGFAQVVRSKLKLNLVPYADADEVFPHLSRNMSENLVAVGQSDAEHCSRQHLGYGSL